MTTTYISPVALAYMVKVYTNAGVFKKNIKPLNAPTLSYLVNSTGFNITLDMPAVDTVTPLLVKGDLIKVGETGRSLRVLIARKSVNLGAAPSSLAGFLRADGFSVTEAYGASVADCRAYDVIVVDANAWSAGTEFSSFIQSLWNDGQQVLVAGNDTGNDIFYSTAGVAAAPVGTTNITATGHPIANGVGTLETDSDSGLHIRGIVAGATKLGDFVGDAAGFSIIEYPQVTSGGNLIHLQSAGVVDGTNWSKLRKNVVNYLAKGRFEVLWSGTIDDIPDSIDQTVEHQIVAVPLGVELADVDFTHNYTSLTDVAVMIRDAVAGCLHLTATTVTVPNTGLTRIYNFNEKSVLDVLQTCAKMAGADYVWSVDELGQVFFGPTASGLLYSVRTRVDAPVRKYTAPITNQKNFVKAFGSIPPGGTVKIVAIYDQSGSSLIGKKALLPPLQFPGLTDQTTLQSIVNTIGAALNQPQVTVVLEMPNSGQRIDLARVGGASIRYWEPNQDDLQETDPGSGTFSPNYVIVQVDITGPVQRVTARGIALNVDDFVNEINNNLDRVATDGTAPTIVGTLPIYPGQVVGATTGGPSTPSTTAWVFAQWSTGIENVAQVNNAYAIVKWTPNAANENIQRYEVRYSKTADGNYFTQSALTGVVDGGGRGFLKIAGLLQGTSYTYEIRAINNLGIASAWSTTQAQTTALDASGPAVPTGLSAIKTPRGALVSWNANTEADLKGYHLQVSVGGGSYTDVAVDSLLTSFYYVAPSGTATGTSLTFKILAADWSGNFSAYSAASSAVATDGIVMDELLVGNLQVFGTMTTGGLQTASSGKRLVLDGTSLRLYDGSTTPYGAPSGPGITVELLASGVGFFQGTVSASKVYGGTLATSAAHDSPNPPSSAGSGFKLSGQFLDFYTVSSLSEGTRYWYAPDTVAGFTLAGQLAAGSMTFAKGSADADTETITSTGGPIKNSALAIASFKPNTTIAKRGSFGAFTITNGGSITPPFGQATASGNLLTAEVACNPATAGAGTGITTATSGWTRATSAISGNVQTDIWYKLNCGAGETAPTFTSTLQAPSAADQVVETITDAGGGAQTANIANVVLASFSPTSSSIPITLVSLGSFTTGTVSQASPAFGAPTTGGNLLLAWVSGDTGIASGGTTTGGWGTATTTFNFSGVNSDNLVFMGPYTMPQLGRITSISVNMGGYDGSAGVIAGSNADTTLCLWDGAGNLFAYGSVVTYGQGRSLRTQAIAFNAGGGSISSIDVTAGSTLYVGFFRARGQTCMWGVRTSGTFKYKTNQTGNGSVAGYTNAAPAYTVGDMQSYFTYTILTAGTDITTTASGWSKAVQSTNSLAQTQIWYKQNCGASEAAPVFTSASGAKTMYAQLGEFAGAVTGSPQDKVGNTNQGAASTSITVTGSAIDAQSGDLVVTASRFEFASAATASFADTLNNGSPISAGNSGGSANVDHANFVYGIVPVPQMHAQVQEWTGALTAGASDKVGNTGQATSATSISATGSTTDTAANDLVITAGRWYQTGSSTASWNDSYNNASPSGMGNSGGSNLSQHSTFSFGIISGSASGAVLQLTNFVGLEAITLDNSLGRGFINTQYSTDGNSSLFTGRKARGTQLVPLAAVNGDSVMALFPQVYDGTNWINSGVAGFVINGTVSAGVVPLKFVISVPLEIPPTANGTAAPSNYGSVPVKIAEQTVSNAANVSFSSIPSGFRDLRIRCRTGSPDAVVDRLLYMQLNSDTAGNYQNVGALFNPNYNTLINSGASVFHLGYSPGSTGANGREQTLIDIFDYNDASNHKSYHSLGGVANVYGAAVGNQNMLVTHGWWKSNAAITSILLKHDIGNITGTFILEGIP